MKTVSMLEFRRDAAKVLRWLRLGKQTIRLTYRGQPVADLVPVKPDLKRRPPRNDPFYMLPEIAVDGQPLSNREMDRLLYEQP